MKLIDTIPQQEGELYSHAIHRLRTELETNHDANFYIFRGVTYDSKTDRYVAAFETGSDAGSRKFTAKCDGEVATFLMRHAEVRGQFFLRLAHGVIIDVTIFDYHKATSI